MDTLAAALPIKSSAAHDLHLFTEAGTLNNSVPKRIF